MDDFITIWYLLVFVYSFLSTLFILAVLVNIGLKNKEKADKWKSYVINAILLVICVSAHAVFLLFKNWGLIICEIEIAFSTYFYTSEWVVNKVNKSENTAMKDLYKNKIVFGINIFVWALYVISEIVLQLNNLTLINVSDTEILLLLKCHEAAILILLAVQLLLSAIKKVKKMKQNCIVENSEEKE